MNRPIAAALLALALAAPAVATADGGGAPQTYDLKTFLIRRLKKGEQAHEHSVEHDRRKQTILKGGQVVNTKDEKAGKEFDRTEAIQTVDAKGQPSGILYTFESFKDVRSGESPDVKGLQVLVKKGADGRWTVTGQGKARVPPVLARYLHHNPSTENTNKDDEAMSSAMLPAKPVALGATWAPDAEKVLAAMDMEKTTLVADKSSVKGTFQGMPNKPGWVEAKIVSHLVFKTFNGVPTDGDLAMDITISFQRPQAASLESRNSMTMTIEGTIQPPGLPPGMSITFDMKNEKHLHREPVSK